VQEQWAELQVLTRAWTLFHSAGISFGIGFAAVMGKAVVDEVREAKGAVGKFFIVCMAIGGALIAIALLSEANRAWRIFV
jgi:hypothetical protein